MNDYYALTPQAIVKELDKHIIGQQEAKRSVAIALRRRFCRMQIESNLRTEITPKNILMIGPTGVGKTEIARRLAKLANAPFIKVEATKFTEVGYVGRDVESIIRDLLEISVKQTKEAAIAEVNEFARKSTIEKILDNLAPKDKSNIVTEDNNNREQLKQQLLNGELDDHDIEIEVSQASIGIEIMSPPGMEEMTNQLQNIFQSLSGEKTRVRKLKVKEAVKLLNEEEACKLINEEELKLRAIERVEQTGIVFLDEIDKITQRSDRQGSDISREGVQRDLLPLIEGSTVSTKYGMVKTDHILFIASGAFHLSKPSDLIPELQGRLPTRVELKALQPEDFMRILVEPSASLTEQYKALLAVEQVDLVFAKDGIESLANMAWKINERTENIGARRLHTIMERLLEDISFRAHEFAGQSIEINAKYVEEQIASLCANEDLSHFIL